MSDDPTTRRSGFRSRRGIVLAIALLVAATGTLVFRASGPALRVASLGDSVAYDGDPGIRAALEATGEVVVDTRSYGGVGLLRPGIDDYLREALDENPDVVVVMLGGWDLGEIVAGPPAYGRRLDEVAGLLTSKGATVIWLGMPPTPPPEGIEEARQTANREFAALADRHDGVNYLDTGQILGDRFGGFTRTRTGVAGTEVQVRKVRDGRDDGHLCPAGAALLGQAVLTAMRETHILPEEMDGWWEGEWTRDARYEDPLGGCAATTD